MTAAASVLTLESVPGQRGPAEEKRRVPISRRAWQGALVAAVLLRVVLFCVSVVRVSPTADEAIAVLQAKQVHNHHFPLLFMAQPYLFPIESYWMAPLVKSVPRNAFGARYLGAILWALSVAASLWICGCLSDFRRAWPAMLLVLFPPAYLLVHEAGTALPSYWGMATFSWLLVVLALTIERRDRPGGAMAALAGLLSGLAFAGQPLSLAVTASCSAAICLGRDARSAIRRTACFMAGAVVGLLPFWLAWWRYNVNPDVSGSRPLSEALLTLLDFPIRGALEKAAGFAPPLFPDGGAVVSLFPALDVLVPWLLGGLVVAVTLERMAAVVKRAAAKRWPSLTVEDVLPAIALLNLFFFAASQRAHIGSARYLLPLVWSVPFLVASISAKLRDSAFVVVAGLCTTVAILNAATGTAVIAKWLEPGFASSIGNLDLEPALQYLRDRGISRCFASYWETYRINFQTNERIACSQPYNERFPGFPLPYHDAVEAAPRVAYFLSPTGWFKPKRFEADMATMGVEYEKGDLGEFVLYHDFRCATCTNEISVPRGEWNPADSRPVDFATWMMEPGRPWQSRGRQAVGMTVEIALAASLPIDRVTLDYAGRDGRVRPRGLALSIHDAGGWTNVSSHPSRDSDPFRLVNGHPSYDVSLTSQTIRFPPHDTDRLRIEIVEPNSWADWVIDDVEIYRSPAP